ncbi:MAG: AI-2E family transporter, partial [Chloroflexi bacterium]|nr:AI-2E family transporter [Chloroflexota bacterium]
LIFFMAWLIAFLLSPAADALERRRLPRGLAVLAVYASLILILVIIGGLLTPILIDQGQELEQQIPQDLDQVLAFVNQIDSELGRWGVPIDLNTMFDAKTILEQVQQWGSVVLENTMNVVTRVTGVVSNFVLILVISVYIMLEGRQMGDGMGRMLPPDWRDEWALLRQTVNQSFGGFVRGQIVLAIVYGIGVGIILLLAGTNFAAITALIATLLAVIPFFGPMLGLLLPAGMAWFQTPWYVAAIVTVVLVVYQFALFQVISPKLMGQSIGLSPLLVLGALLVGMQVAGIWGALFGVPVAAVIYTMGRFFHRRLQVAWGELPAPDAGPPGETA